MAKNMCPHCTAGPFLTRALLLAHIYANHRDKIGKKR